MLIRARMRAGGAATDVCVRNVSSRGMLLLAHEVPAQGTYVEILLPDDVVVGRVMWAGERRFGIRARDRIPLHRLLDGQARQAAVTAGAMPKTRSAGAALNARPDARYAGRSMEFLFLVACIVTVSIFAAILAFQMLASVTADISAHL